MKAFIETGRIVGTHGLRGEMRVQPWCDAPSELANYKKLYLASDGGEALEIDSVRTHGAVVLIKAKGVDDIDRAQALRGRILYVARADISLEQERYLIADLIGCAVYDARTGKPLGKLADVSKTGANDVWHIACADRTYLIPVIDEVVQSVDVQNKSILIKPLKGIFDED